MLVDWCGVVRGKLNIFLLLAGLFDHALLDILFKRDWLVALAAELGHDDRDEAAESHAQQIGECTGEDADENGDEHSEEGAAKEHVHLAVVAVMVVAVAVVLHVVRRAVVSTRAEPVRWLALDSLFCHGVVLAVRALHAMRSLLAARSSLVHVLEVLDAVSHDALPLAEKRPLLAVLLFLGRTGVNALLCIERGDHETARGILEEVDSDGRCVHGCRFDGGDLEGHGEQLHTLVGHRLGRVEVEGVAGDAQAQGLLGVGVDLGDIEGLGGDGEGWWVELDAVDLERVLLGADLEVKELVLLGCFL